MKVDNLEGILTVDSLGPHRVRELEGGQLRLTMPDGSSLLSRYCEYHGKLAYRLYGQVEELKPQDGCCYLPPNTD